MAVDYGEDFISRIVGVHWRKKEEPPPPTGGGFSFAGYVSLNNITPPTSNSIGQSTPHFTWLGGASSDGEKWRSGQSETGLALFCCVSGTPDIIDEKSFVTVAAGSVIVGPYDFGPGYSLNYGTVPAAGISYDGGATWSDAGLPIQEHILRPPNPVTGLGADSVQGNANAVAYNPDNRTFYVGASLIFVTNAGFWWEDRMYSSGSGSGFSEVYSERRELFVPFPGYRWPAGTSSKPVLVADATGTTRTSDGTRLVVSFSAGQQVEYTDRANRKTYLSVGEGGTGVTLGDGILSVPMAIVHSVCGGKGHIVAVGWEDENERRGPVTYVSDDDGVTWTAQLADLATTNPEPGEELRAGDLNGSCSFS